MAAALLSEKAKKSRLLFHNLDSFAPKLMRLTPDCWGYFMFLRFLKCMSESNPKTYEANSFQKRRGLRQYQQQQERSNSEQQTVLPNSSSSVLLEKPKVGTGLAHDLAPEFVNIENEQVGIHALDPYFSTKLGNALAFEFASPPKPDTTIVDRGQTKEQIQQVTAKKKLGLTAKWQTKLEAKLPAKPQGWTADQKQPQKAKKPVKIKEAKTPYQHFVAELSNKDMAYLLEQSNAALQTLLLKNTTRHKRSQILQQMPRKQRALLLRSWAESNEKLDSEGFLRAFYWLRRKVRPEYSQTEVGDMMVEGYPEVNGMKILSTILDGLKPEQEQDILQSFFHSDNELAAWLERDRGSTWQRQILSVIVRQASDLELALLFGIPRYGRLLRHLLAPGKKLDILNASIELAQLPQDQRQKLEGKLFASFPVLQEWQN